MNQGLTLITPTGGRTKAAALCQRWMAAQTYSGPVRWIVVDDGEQPEPWTFRRDGWSLELIRRESFWKHGENTQAVNLLTALDRVSISERVVCIENDDHYSPQWLEIVDKHLERAELVGEYRARYYNVATKQGRQLNNTQHASLCCTAMRGAAIETFRKVCKPGVQFIDLSLWRAHPSKLLFSGANVTGIKGLPGRCGIGVGHKPDFHGTKDTDGALLREWIGQDAELYIGLTCS